MSTSPRAVRTAVRAHDDVLGYLVKHVHLLLDERTDKALEPFGVTARDLGVLRVIAGGDPTSQQDVASLLGVDRTSMVTLLDLLEAKGVVSRRPSERDRRRNLVELTESGRELFQRAEAAALVAERTVTAELGDAGAADLRRSLRALLDLDTAPKVRGARRSAQRLRHAGDAVRFDADDES